MERMMILQLEEQPPLIQAVFAGELEQVRSLLEYKENVNYQDDEKRSALHAAAFMGDAGITRLLIEHGARVNAKDSKWLTPLHRACSSGSEETMSVLLSHDADTSARDRQWQTPLHVAAAHNALDFVSTLLEKIPNPNVTDRSGSTALHHAVLNGHNDVAGLLISKGCVVNACDRKDRKPLHWAAFMGHVDTIELLLRNGADVNVRDRNSYTPLHVAAASGMAPACRILLSYGADINCQNAYGNTPLHIACLNGHVLVCQELVSNGCDKEALNYRGQTPLHIAAVSTHGVHCLNYLVNLRVNINKQSLDGRTPLHMTAIHGRFTRSKTLFDRGAIVDCVDKNGCTALHIAAQHGHELLSNTLLSYGADASKKGHEGRTALHMCCLSGYVECCRSFIKAGVDINARDDSEKTPTHCAAYKGSVECLDLLVSSGADFKTADDIGRTALHYAAAQGYFDCVFTLVGIGGSVNQTDNEGCTALHLAAAYDLEGRCVDYLIQHKADPRLKDKNGFIPVHYAVAGNNLCGLRYLLDSCGGAYRLYGLDMPPTTPLHIAAKNGNMEVLEKLMPYFPEPNIRTEHGCTPLLLAARESFANCVQLLLRFGAKVSICDSVHNMSPIHHSAKNGHVHCLALLVDNAEDKGVIDLPDKLQRTALMLAVSNAHSDCVLALIKSGADPNVVDADFHSCLFRSVVADQHNILQMLLPRSSSVNRPDANGKTVLHIAAACGRVSCLQRILNYMERGAAAAGDKQGFTALHWACYSGSSECAEHLLKEDIFKTLDGNAFSPVHCATCAGSEKCLTLLRAHFGADVVKLRDARSRTPLHVAALHDRTECALYLLRQGAEIECKDEDGRTPLIAAAQNGQVHIIEVLIRHKADLTSADKNGNTALHLSCLEKHSQAALLLLEYTDDASVINVANNDRKTPLHLSARNGLVDVTRQLILKGSSVVAVDSYGLTPALCCAPNPDVAQCLAIILASYSAGGNKDFLLNPRLFKKTRAETRTSDSQTEINLVRDPDCFELGRIFGVKPRPPGSRRDLLRLTSSIVQNFFEAKHVKKQKGTGCFIVENYDGGDLSRATEKPGRDLHKSQSDMTLATKTTYSEEDYGRIIQSSREKERRKGGEFIMQKFLESTAMSYPEEMSKRPHKLKRSHFLDDEARKRREPKAKTKCRGGAKPKQKMADTLTTISGYCDHILDTVKADYTRFQGEGGTRSELLSVATFINGAKIEKCGDDSQKKLQTATGDVKKRTKANARELSFAHISPVYVSEVKPRCYPTFWCFPEVKKQQCRDLRTNPEEENAPSSDGAQRSSEITNLEPEAEIDANSPRWNSTRAASPSLEISPFTDDESSGAFEIENPGRGAAVVAVPKHYDRKLKLEINKRLRRRAEEEQVRRNAPRSDAARLVEDYAIYLRDLAAQFDCVTQPVENDVKLIGALYCERDCAREEAARLDREILGLGRKLVRKCFPPTHPAQKDESTQEAKGTLADMVEKLYATRDELVGRGEDIEFLDKQIGELEVRVIRRASAQQERDLRAAQNQEGAASLRKLIKELVVEELERDVKILYDPPERSDEKTKESRDRAVNWKLYAAHRNQPGAVEERGARKRPAEQCPLKRQRAAAIGKKAEFRTRRAPSEAEGLKESDFDERFLIEECDSMVKIDELIRKDRSAEETGAIPKVYEISPDCASGSEKLQVEDPQSVTEEAEALSSAVRQSTESALGGVQLADSQDLSDVQVGCSRDATKLQSDNSGDVIEVTKLSVEDSQDLSRGSRIEDALSALEEDAIATLDVTSSSVTAEQIEETDSGCVSVTQSATEANLPSVANAPLEGETRSGELKIEDAQHVDEETVSDHISVSTLSTVALELRLEKSRSDELQITDSADQSVTERLQIEDAQEDRCISRDDELQIEGAQEIIEGHISLAQSVTEVTSSSIERLQIEDSQDISGENELQVEDAQEIIEGHISLTQSVTEMIPSSIERLQIEDAQDISGENELQIAGAQEIIEGHISLAHSVTEVTSSNIERLQIEDSQDISGENELQLEGAQEIIVAASSIEKLQIEDALDISGENDLQIEGAQEIIVETSSIEKLQIEDAQEIRDISRYDELRFEDVQDMVKEFVSDVTNAKLQIQDAQETRSISRDNESQIEDAQEIIEQTASGRISIAESVTEATLLSTAKQQSEETRDISRDGELHFEDVQDMIQEFVSDVTHDTLQARGISRDAGETASEVTSSSSTANLQIGDADEARGVSRDDELQVEDAEDSTNSVTRSVTDATSAVRLQTQETRNISRDDQLNIAVGCISVVRRVISASTTKPPVISGEVEMPQTGDSGDISRETSHGCITLPEEASSSVKMKHTDDTIEENEEVCCAPPESVVKESVSSLSWEGGELQIGVAVPQSIFEDAQVATYIVSQGVTLKRLSATKIQIESASENIAVPQSMIGLEESTTRDEEGVLSAMTDDDSDPHPQGVIEENAIAADVSCATQFQIDDNVLSECTDVSDGGQDKSEEFHDFPDLDEPPDDKSEEQNSSAVEKTEEAPPPKTKKSFPSLSKLGKKTKKESNCKIS